MKDEELFKKELEQLDQIDEEELEQLKQRAREEYEKQLNNLIDMMREFDYRRNGKSTTIDFLAYMIQQFNEFEF